MFCCGVKCAPLCIQVKMRCAYVLHTLLQDTDEEPGVGSLTTARRTTRGRAVVRRGLLAVLLARELALTLAWGSTGGRAILSLLA